MTVVDTVDDNKVTTLHSVSPPCNFLRNMTLIVFQNTKNVMEKPDKGKQRACEEDESQDYDILRVDDTFANYRVPSNTLDPNESTNVLAEERETVSPTENEESSVCSQLPHIVCNVDLPHRHPRLSSMHSSTKLMKRITMHCLL